jgi:hypothetical protein
MYRSSGSFSFGATNTGGVESTFFSCAKAVSASSSTQIYHLIFS